MDSSGAAYVAGFTASNDFPTTANALQRSFQGGSVLGPLTYGDAFVAKLNPAGNAVTYGPYLGDSQAGKAFAEAVDPNGRMVVTGATDSTDFPVSPSAWQSARGGGSGMPQVFNDGFPDGRIHVNVEGNVRATIEGRTTQGCDSSSGIVVFDGGTGRPVSGSANVDVQGAGSVYIGAKFNASHFGSAPFGTRALRVDFAKQNDVAPACITNAATLLPDRVNGTPTNSC